MYPRLVILRFGVYIYVNKRELSQRILVSGSTVRVRCSNDWLSWGFRAFSARVWWLLLPWSRPLARLGSVSVIFELIGACVNVYRFMVTVDSKCALCVVLT